MKKEFVRYLKELFEYEQDRGKVIENKLSQLLGQSGLIFALSSLFIPLFYSYFKNAPCYFTLICILLYLISLFLLSWCNFLVAKTFDVRKYKYMTGSTETVKKKFASEDDFHTEEIDDSIKSIERNIETNSLKATHLIQASNRFTFGIIGIGILSLLLIIGFLFIQPSENEVKISNQVNLEKLERSVFDMNDNLKRIKSELDSISAGVKIKK